MSGAADVGDRSQRGQSRWKHGVGFVLHVSFVVILMLGGLVVGIIVMLIVTLVVMLVVKIVVGRASSVPPDAPNDKGSGVR